MNHFDIHLLDLPNEILLIIFKKLDNIDVLYSLLGINNERLDTLVQDGVLTNTLDFVTTSSTTDVKFDRFCTYILPRIHHSVKKLILETTSMERILLTADYPNLTYLELFNFKEDIACRYFTHDSSIRHIFKHQITDLILHNNDELTSETSLEDYTRNVYSHILALFQNLKNLTIVSSCVNEYPPLLHCRLPPATYFSSMLTVLCTNVYHIDDCLSLLDGRLKQLATFVVHVHYMGYSQLISPNMDELHNLKCFSLTSYPITQNYVSLIVPLLRRMIHLEKLTLYLRIRNRNAFVDGTHLNNEILVHMPQLHTFIFYISTENNIASVHRLSNDDIQRTFTNIRYGQTASIVNYFSTNRSICCVFSLPFTFTYLEKITNQFPKIVFEYVTYLHVIDAVPFEHEFFMRIGRAFPLLKSFCVMNLLPQSSNVDELESDNNPSYSIVEYFHLTSLDVTLVNIDYIVQFFHETKAYIPRLTELKVSYNELQTVTMNFTRGATRRNCAKVKRLIVEGSIVFSQDVYEYFSFFVN